MANLKHVMKLKEAVEAWNEWRKENLRVEVDLSRADLMVAKLIWAQLRGPTSAVRTLRTRKVSRRTN
jgi:hypothetical protein